MHILIAKNFCGEGFDLRAILPGVKRKAGFPAGVFEKSDAVPTVLDGNLRQEQAAVARHADEQTVASDLDFFGSNWTEAGQNTQRYFKS